MNDGKRNIDEFFLEELGNATETPPSSVWDTLEKRLDDNSSRRPVFSWWFYLLIAALFVGGSIAAYYATRPALLTNHTTTQPAPVITPSSNTTTNSLHNTDTTNLSAGNITKKHSSKTVAGSNTQLHRKNTLPKTAAVVNNTAIATHATGTAHTRNNVKMPDHTTGTQATPKTVVSNTAPHHHKTEPLNDPTSFTGSAATKTTAANTSLPHHNKPDHRKPSNKNNTPAEHAVTNTPAANTEATNSPISPSPNKHNKIGTQSSNNRSGATAGTNTIAGKTTPVKSVKEASEAANTQNTGDKNTAHKAPQHRKERAVNTAAKTDKTDGIAATKNKAKNKAKKEATTAYQSGNKNSAAVKHLKNDQPLIKNTAPASGIGAVNKKNTTTTTDLNTKKAISKPAATASETAQHTSVKNPKPASKIKVAELSKITDSTKPSSVYQSNTANLKKEQEPKAAKTQHKIANKLKDKDFLSGIPTSTSADDNTTPDLLKEPNSSSSGGNSAGTPDTKGKKNRKPLNMLIGVKAGYERGGNTFTADKYVGTIFGEVKFTNRLSFLLQPSIKIAKTNQSYNQTTGNYYKLGPDSTYSTLYHIAKDTITGEPVYNYAYKQSYDSMIASIQAQRRFLELELPFLFKYKIDDHFSVMLGINFTFGKLIALDNNLRTISGLTITDTVLNSKDSTAPAASSKFSHTGSTPFSSYTAPASNTTPSPIRFGYSFGLSYTFKERFLVDLLIQQNLSGYNNITDPGIRKIYSQAYIRLSLGYTLFGAHKK